MRRLIVVLLLVAYQSALTNANEVTLVKDRRAVAVIVLRPEASWIERHAANELSQFVLRITGASLPIVETGVVSADRDTTRVLIGSPQRHARIRHLVGEGIVELNRRVMGADGFAIKTVVHDDYQYLILSGFRGRAQMYAVYDFLEQDCGVGYFWDGDQVPQQSTLRVPAPQRAERPYFSRRMAPNACSYVYSSQYWGVDEWKRAHDYMLKRKLNVSYFTLGREMVMERVWQRFGMRTPPLSKWAQWEYELQRAVGEYARKLDMELVGQLWGGHVSPEFAATHPQLKYVVAQWAGVSKSYNIHPQDPMFGKVVEASVKEWTAAYGPTQLWDQAPYPETSPGATAAEKRQIKMDWARHMSAALARADPHGTLYMSGWFLQGADWTPEVCRDFFGAMTHSRFLVADVWAETKPVFLKTGYFGGEAEWMFGVLNTFGNVERLHGDLRDLLRRVQHVVDEPASARCTGFYINPESTHHNFLYFDFAAELAWDPREIELDAFLLRYCVRRYGVTAAAKMVDVWKRVVETAYADNLEANPRPFYQSALPYDGGGADLFADPRKIKTRYTQTAELWRALRLAVTQRNELEANQFYQRDVIDIARTLLGMEFDYQALRAYQAFTVQSDEVALAAAGRDALERLQWVESLTASREEFWLANEISLGRQRPSRRQPVHSRAPASPSHLHANDQEVRLRFTALAGMDKYPGLLDYASTDRVELLRGYYRPRVKAWLRHMQRRLQKGVNSVDYGMLLQGAYRDIAEEFVGGEMAGVDAASSRESTLDIVEDLLEEYGKRGATP
ncbi:MAG: hypothetical protein CMJ75_13440 [Planctomycetaceae bacterium]|nr:hypothetical protein [Planctomycetaceae bacterium]